jgi:hypothetical protein
MTITLLIAGAAEFFICSATQAVNLDKERLEKVDSLTINEIYQQRSGWRNNGIQG